MAVDSPTPFTVIKTVFRPHDRAVKSKGLDQIIEAWLLGNLFCPKAEFITETIDYYRAQ